MTSIKIPSSVTHICQGAFHGCTSLTSIVVSSSVSSITSPFTDGCTSLKSVTCLGVTPPSVYDLGMEVYDKYCTLHVLPGSGSAYRSSSYWSNYYIVEDAVPQCETPEIELKDGKFSATCLTKDVTYSVNSFVNLGDTWREADGEIPVSITINVVAKKDGCEDSEPATCSFSLQDLIGKTGDIDRNNKVTIKDVNALINILLKQ